MSSSISQSKINKSYRSENMAEVRKACKYAKKRGIRIPAIIIVEAQSSLLGKGGTPSLH